MNGYKLNGRIIALSGWITALGLGLMLGGCTQVVVKNTDGIRECISQEGKAEVFTQRVKSQYAPTTVSYKRAEGLYTQATDAVNAFLRSISLTASEKLLVDVPLTAFTDSEAGRSLKVLNEETEKMITMGIDAAVLYPMLTTASVYANDVATRMNGENGKEGNDPIDRIVSLLERAEMLPFPELSGKRIKEKYAK
jgi:hypothetical protein